MALLQRLSICATYSSACALVGILRLLNEREFTARFAAKE